MPEENTIRLLAARPRLQEKLAEFLRGQRWFGGKAQSIRALEIVDMVPITTPAATAYFLLLRVGYHDDPDETYSVPLIPTSTAAAIPLVGGAPAPHVQLPGGDTGSVFLYDATASDIFLGSLLSSIRKNQSLRGEHGELRLQHGPVLERLAPAGESGLAPHLMRAEQSNTSIVYGDRLVLKLFRRAEAGINPDLEIGRFLTEKTGFRHVPLTAGYLEYRADNGACTSLGILQSFVANQGDAWKFTLLEVERYFQRVPTACDPPHLPSPSFLALAAGSIPDQAQQLVGGYVGSAQLLGKRTAELHRALSQSVGDPAFDPEPYSPQDRRAFSEGALDLLRRNLRLLQQQQPALPPSIRAEARKVLDCEAELERRFRRFEGLALTSLRTRLHGDYHLGQVLVSGNDFIIIDFEGEPARPLAERRCKRSPLQDVAGMLRSFHYAAYAPLLAVGAKAGAIPRPLETFGPWAHLWQMWVSAAFLGSYFATARSAPFNFRDPQELATILEAHVLEKAVYELGYELNNRPSWVRIPLSGIAQLIGA